MLSLLYLGTGIQDTAYPSQVEALLKLAGQDLQISHVSLEPWHQWRESLRRHAVGPPAVPTEFVRAWPVVGRASLALDGRAIAAHIGRHGRPFVVHARGQINAYRARAMRRLAGLRGIVADFRGALGDENVTYAGSGVWNWIRRKRGSEFERVERTVVAESDHILCVSHAFARYLRDRYAVPAERVTVMPSFVDLQHFGFSPALRDGTRARLGVTKRFVLVYSGGQARWQMARETVDLFRTIRKHVPEAYLVFLTHRPDSVRHLVSGLSDDEHLLASARPEEVAAFLCAADAGVLLRERTLTNRVASPIKFSEYLVCGLPVILSGGIGDTEEHVRRLRAGLVLDSECAPARWDDVVAALRAVDRAAIAGSAANVFGLQRLAPALLDLYRSFA